MRVHQREADTVAWLDVRNVVVTVGANKRFIQARHPFATNDLVRVGPTRDTFVVARRTVDGDKARVRLSWFDLSGQRVRERTIDLPLVAIPRLVRDSVIDHFTKALTESTISPTTDAARALVLRALQVPQHYPAFADLIIGTDGSLWLNRGSNATSEIWLHLSPSGAAVANIAIPAGIRLLHVRPPYAWGRQTSMAGVPTVVRLRVD